MLSTNPVENIVKKTLLTGWRARLHAGFNKLPNPGAKNKPFEINVLGIVVFLQ